MISLSSLLYFLLPFSHVYSSDKGLGKWRGGNRRKFNDIIIGFLPGGKRMKNPGKLEKLRDLWDDK